MNKRRYLVTAEMTISVHVEVEAASPAEAKRFALAASRQTFCNGCARTPTDEDPEWRTSGELDGEPTNLRVEEA